MKQYETKRAQVEAIQLLAQEDINKAIDWVNETQGPAWATNYGAAVRTIEGVVPATIGDYVVKTHDGRVDVMNKTLFESIYAEV